MAWPGSSVLLTGTRGDGSLDYWWQAAGTAPWNPETISVGGL